MSFFDKKILMCLKNMLLDVLYKKYCLNSEISKELKMENKNFWCINDEWINIHSKTSENGIELSDIGVGLAWANEWRPNASKLFANTRKKSVCYDIGLEVWYYPEECKGYFYNWLDGYILFRKEKLSSKGKKDPVLPTEKYHQTEKYMNKKVYFTGFYKDDNETIDNIIVPQTGIIVCEKFVKTLDFLILGPNRGERKIREATKWGMPCISVEVFIDEITS